MIPVAALRTPVGAAYLGGAAVSGLLCVTVGLATVQRHLREEGAREAVQAFAQGLPDARPMLLEACSDDPDSGRLRLLLGVWELERADGDAGRLEAAERLFEEARGRDPEVATQATIGLALCRLALAEGQPRAGREAAARDAEQRLQGLAGPDVEGARAAAALFAGRAAEAAGLLGEEPAPELSLAGRRAWSWNRAAAGVLGRERAALAHALQAYALRWLPLGGDEEGGAPEGEPSRRDDPARLLAAAYRVSLGDAGAQPATPEALGAACALAERATKLRFSGGAGRGAPRGRFLPPTSYEPPIHNALGLGLYRAGRFDEAAAAFSEALRGSREPLYALNRSEALRQAAERLQDAPKERNERLGLAAESLRLVADWVKDQEGREDLAQTALRTSAALSHLAGATRDVDRLLMSRKELLPPPAFHRDMGAVLDHLKQRACVDHYKKALELGHPDALGIQARLRQWERRR